MTTILVILGVSVIVMILGALWYSPVLFGNTWMRLSGITLSQIEKQKKKGMLTSYVVNFVATIVTVYVLSMLLALTRATNVVSALFLAILIWIGFFAMPMLNAVLWEKRPFSLYMLNAGHHLVGLLIASALLVSLL